MNEFFTENDFPQKIKKYFAELTIFYTFAAENNFDI